MPGDPASFFLRSARVLVDGFVTIDMPAKRPDLRAGKVDCVDEACRSEDRQRAREGERGIEREEEGEVERGFARYRTERGARGKNEDRK